MFIILDPASSEVNRGSYCYLPYLLYSAMAAQIGKHNVILVENFTIEEFEAVFENMPENTTVLCALWSYPQSETCIAVNVFMQEKRYGLAFFGYEPLIKKLGLPLYDITPEMLRLGMKNYIRHIANNGFANILLSDCDKHLSELGKGNVVPMFTSYGCPRGCSFCSASKNTHGKRYELPFQDIEQNLQILAENEINGIHFTDEDFFYSPSMAMLILETAYNINPNFQIIALGHASTFYAFYRVLMRDHPEKLHKMKILKLVEIGLETADEKAAGVMGKVGVAKNQKLAEIAQNELCKILWLTMTFYPGDSIRAINRTGAFLRQYGFKLNDLCPRIRTNGTEGGLGQFYQFYEGCADMGQLELNGEFLTDRPMRLWPSYLPNSFLWDKFTVDYECMDSRKQEYYLWCQTNKCMQVAEHVYRKVFSQVGQNQVCSVVDLFAPYMQVCQTAIAVATLARLQMIKGVE